MPASERSTGGQEGQLSGAFVVALLKYLERAAGPELPCRVLAAAGCRESVHELLRARWVASDLVIRLAEEASALTGDGEIGRRVGEELFRMTVRDPATAAFFLSSGSPAGALTGVLEHTAKLGRGRRYRLASSEDGACVIEGSYENPQRGHPFFCGLPLGFWPMMASLFGAVGTAMHPTCQCRGDDVCTFVVRWDPGATASDDTTAAASAELSRKLNSFEQMQTVAEELARAADLHSLAEAILDGVEAITPAPQLVAAIRRPGDEGEIVAGRRLSGPSAEQWARRLLADELVDSDDPAPLGGGSARSGSGSARSGSARSGAGDSAPSGAGHPSVVARAALGRFGVVAAIAPDATAVSATSSRLLEAFARHAVARIEAVIARQAAETNRQTAASLLRLAGALAATTSEQEVSNCLSEEIPQLVGADHSSILRWDPTDQKLIPVAYVGPAGQTPYPGFTFNQAPSLADFPAQPTPLVLERSKADEFVADAMRRWDEEINVAVPLFVEGSFFALVCAGYCSGNGFDRGSALSRLQGAADLALTAYTKARLLDDIRHQALHDDLTGLPNRTLLEKRVRRSIAEAHRNHSGMALLFIDLDRFKTINDSMGHNFGDTLIQHATRRIRESLDAGDFLARMGGDEFVVVLDGVDCAAKAEAVAAQILARLRLPLDIDGHRVSPSASIGVAVYPEDGDQYGLLLQAADSSMYAAKRAGRGTVRRRDWTAALSATPL